MNHRIKLPFTSRTGRRWGQHFLIDESVCNRLAELAEEHFGEAAIIIEPGAGFGAVTKALLSVGKPVLAAEKDPSLCEIIPRTVASKAQPNLSVVCCDVLSVRFLRNIAVVGAPPYSISCSLLSKMIVDMTLGGVLVLQREFCEKLISRRSKHYLKKFLDTFGEIKEDISVSKNSFFPIPKVDSKIIVVKLNKRKETGSELRAEYLKFLVTASRQYKRRKVEKYLRSGKSRLDTYRGKRIFQLSADEIFELFLAERRWLI